MRVLEPLNSRVYDFILFDRPKESIIVVY
jgi:hypothetical protein